MRILLATFLTFLFFCTAIEGQISFRQASYNQCKTTAITSQLPFVVYVTAKWCLNCKLMEETTFLSQGLKFAVDGKYNTYKIDFDSYEAKDWKKKFAIRSVPAFLIFDSNGEIIQRVDKSLTSTKIIDLLKNPHEFSGENTSSSHRIYQHEYAAGPYKNDFYNWTVESGEIKNRTTPVTYTQKVVVKQEVKSALIADNNELPFYDTEEQKLSFYLTPSDVKIVEEIVKGQIKIPDNYNASKSKEVPDRKKQASKKMEEIAKFVYRVSDLYYSKIKEGDSNKKTNQQVEFGNKMYRVQFGIFADINDAKGLVKELRRQQPYPIFTLYESRAGLPIYRIVVGKFSTIQEANIVKDEIYIKGLEALVIEI